jgi:hypothetical protein
MGCERGRERVDDGLLREGMWRVESGRAEGSHGVGSGGSWRHIAPWFVTADLETIEVSAARGA